MSLNTQDFNSLVANQIAAAQASSNQLLDFSNGSVLLALMQSNASAVALWLQAMNISILALTRAATSNGVDLDTWMADYGLFRLPATPASGTVVFSRVNNTVQAVIPAGVVSAIVQTSNGVVSYTVDLDETNPAYSASLGGYVLTSGTSSISLGVTANTDGGIGNSAANTITVINTPIPYIDSVTNPSTFTNGLNAETDAEFRVRFVLYLASLSKATLAAISYAVSQVVGVIDYTITENYTYLGVQQFGYFYVVVDDGTGTPSSGLIANVNAAVDEVRGLTIRFGVYAPIIVEVDVIMSVIAKSGYTHDEIVTSVTEALTTYINTLPLGTTLYYTQLISVAYGASAGVLDVNTYTLNGTNADVVATAKQIIKLDNLVIN